MRHLLIVEDDRALGDGVRLALQHPDLEAVLCRSLAEARTALESRTFDLLILDVGLPEAADWICCGRSGRPPPCR